MTARSELRLGDLFPDLGLVGAVEAYRSLEIRRIASVEMAREGDLVFVAQENLLTKLKEKESTPTAVVVSESFGEKVLQLGLGFPVLISRDVMLAFAKTSRHFRTDTAVPAGVHPSAVVHPSAKLSRNISVGPFCVVGAGAEIGEGSILHARVEVGDRARVGAGSELFGGVVLYQDCVLGERVRVHANSVIGADGFGYVQEVVGKGVQHVKIHHSGCVRVGDDTEIGASTTIDRGTLEDTVIGRGCIIDNQVQIGHNTKVGNGVIICGCCAIAGSAKIGDFAVIAGFTAISNKIEIGAGAKISGFSAVHSKVPAGETYGGIPVMPHRQWLKAQALIARLPELFDELRKQKGKA